ncbi:MAG: 4Fe-4S dicluster domain-containing protein [Desulfopila sp.]|nr:4Fe-4S dicluster domain-containing protein [Desulfopila sp.]
MKKPRGMIIIDAERCKGCCLCCDACPEGILFLNDAAINSKGYQSAAITDMAQCIACCYCALVCPDVAISVKRLSL